VRSLVSPVEGSKNESSNVDRDIENFNLIKSWERNEFIGQGFGHAFTEFTPSNDFRQSNFGHVGHNSLLWLLWIGGIFGFVGMLAYVGVGIFFFARTLRRVHSPDERAALLVAVSVLIVFLSQSYGDMGTQSIEIGFFVAAALAIIGRLTTRHQAWRSLEVAHGALVVA
jgi:4-amino-4-deoxy-L-arabinose transferase-like glycosyltransferase